MRIIPEAIRSSVFHYNVALDVLDYIEIKTPAKPELHCTYETYNHSMVHVIQKMDNGDFVAVLLRGGHGVPDLKGYRVADTFTLREDGLYGSCEEDDVYFGAESALSLLKKLYDGSHIHPRVLFSNPRRKSETDQS